MGSCEVLHAEVLNMRLQGQRLTEYVNTKWEEMIRNWRAAMYVKTEPYYAEQFQTRQPRLVNEHVGFFVISRYQVIRYMLMSFFFWFTFQVDFLQQMSFVFDSWRYLEDHFIVHCIMTSP